MGRTPVLADGEKILIKCKATCTVGLRSLWQGDLYLTSNRLIWLRHGFSLPFPKPDSIEINVVDITRVKFSDAAGTFGILWIDAAGKRYSFIPYRFVLAAWIFFNGRLTRQLGREINAVAGKGTD